MCGSSTELFFWLFSLKNTPKPPLPPLVSNRAGMTIALVSRFYNSAVRCTPNLICLGTSMAFASEDDFCRVLIPPKTLYVRNLCLLDFTVWISWLKMRLRLCKHLILVCSLYFHWKGFKVDEKAHFALSACPAVALQTYISPLGIFTWSMRCSMHLWANMRRPCAVDRWVKGQTTGPSARCISSSAYVLSPLLIMARQ